MGRTGRAVRDSGTKVDEFGWHSVNSGLCPLHPLVKPPLAGEDTKIGGDRGVQFHVPLQTPVILLAGKGDLFPTVQPFALRRASKTTYLQATPIRIRLTAESITIGAPTTKPKPP